MESAGPDATMSGVWQRSSEVAAVPSENRVALLDLEHLDRPPLILEGSAAVIWELLERPSTEPDLVAAVADHFGVSSNEVARPVADFLSELAEAGLVHPGAGS